MSDLPRSVTEAFAVEGPFVGAEPLGHGHIHRTFVARYGGGDATRRVVHQEVNTRVFRDAHALMDNVSRVCGHLRRKAAALADSERRVLRVIEARDGGPLHLDEHRRPWRSYAFVEGTRSHETMPSAALAERAARAFAQFAASLIDLEGAPLTTTIPHFHDTAKRWRDLEASLERDQNGRARLVEDEIAQARATLRWLETETTALDADALPQRVVHNDCKLNNLLCDESTGEPLCVIDLDTVMAGTVAVDFGELVRTSVCDAPEDTRDLDTLRVDGSLLAALAQGYVAGAASFVTRAELEALPTAGALLAFENGIRFLADHVDGDRYFRVHREGQNLDRARAQLRLAEELAAAREAAAEAVAEAARQAGLSR